MKDLTKGSPAKMMLQFALPVALGNLFQLFYSLADTRVVGSTLGETALAAVGATTSVSTLFIGFLSGLTNGFALLIAREFGAGQEKGVRRRLFLGAVTACFLTAVCVGGLNFFLMLLNVPDDLMGEASAYIRIILAGLIMTMLYNACAAILRAVGDTAAPLAFLMFASLLNIGLDLLFIMGFQMGVSGAALATVVSQSVSAFLCLAYMIWKYPVFRFKTEDFKITKEEIKRMYGSGLSMAAMMSLVFFGTLSLQCAINTFGREIIVAHTAARKITEFFMLPLSVMGVTMATYCGQNMGAGRVDRIRTGIRQALFIAWGWAVGMMILSYTAAPQMIYLVTGSHIRIVLDTASMYLKVNTVFYFVPSAISVFRNALQGMGDHTTPVLSSFIELAGKVAVAVILTKILKYWGIIAAEPIVWVLMVIPLAARIRRVMEERI